MIHEVQNDVYDQAINDSYHEIDDIFLLFLPQKNSFQGGTVRRPPCTLNAADMMLKMLMMIMLVVVMMIIMATTMMMLMIVA